MDGINIYAQTVAGAYHQLLDHALTVESHKGGYKDTSVEWHAANITVYKPKYNLIANKNRKFNYRYMIAEFLWNTCATRDISILTKVFPGVTRFVQDQPKWSRDLVAWAYGPTMSSGLKGVLQELRDDPGSRRAVVTLSHPFSFAKQTLGNGTPPCLVSVQWMIRDGALHQYTVMRSNDIWRGFPLDLYQFSMWQLLLAAALGVRVGEYHHHVGSLHLYERDRAAAVEMMQEEFLDVKSSMPEEGALEHLLYSGGRHVLDIMRSNEKSIGWDDSLHVYINSYLGYPEMEFRILKDGGYGAW